MEKQVPIAKIMTKPVITVGPNDALAKAETLFKKYHIRHIPVVEGKEIIGMLSYTDLLRISFADAVDLEQSKVDESVYAMFNIKQVMAKDVISVSPEASIQAVAHFLTQKEFHALPVVSNNRLVGILTTTDIIRYLLSQYERTRIASPISECPKRPKQGQSEVV
ncbi:MAG: CBS domain-containing protein [Bacteroidota bacterium]